jgi:hypothetical protein
MNVYCLLADAVAVFHFAFVAFIVGGLVAIVAGVVLRWPWVRNFYFRAIHLAMIAIVVEESLLGVGCPLTDWEDNLRLAGGAAVEPNSFIGRLIHSLLFVNLSPSVLCVCYVVFGLAVLLVFIFAPPRWPRRVRKT